jgi:putative hydrolases of HD superfamily
MSDAKKIIDFIKFAEGLKSELRHASKSNGQRESVAEHSWNLALTLFLVAPYLKIKLDMERALKMIIVHDLGEIEAGDVSRMLQAGDQEIRDKKFEAEEKSMKKISQAAGISGSELYGLWEEYEAMETNEAKVVKALDAFEGQFQFLSDPVTKFTKDDADKVHSIISETSGYLDVDPFLKELDELTLPELKKRAGV